jgi:hypothetical protein
VFCCDWAAAALRTSVAVVPSAPRYSPRLLAAVRQLDDRTVPLAETCRRVGAAAERLGLPRPSYVHLRRVILEERRRRDELRAIAGDVARDTARGLVIDPIAVAERIRNARS